MPRSLPLATFALAASAALAQAHDARTVSVGLRVDDARITVRYALHPTELVALVPDCDADDDGLLTRAEFAAAVPRLAARIEDGLELEAAGQRLRGALAADLFPAARVVALGDAEVRLGVVLDYPATPGDLTLRSRVLVAGTATQELIELPDGGAAVLHGPDEVATWQAPRSALAQVAAFVEQGVIHILIGWDHLAFLLALLLVARRLRDVAATVTAFTLAHSVTLALAALGLLSPPATLVEAAIAASIAWVAFENLTGAAERAPGRRWALTFAFGLVHGFGFGGVLLELELGDPLPTLIGFNLGVELGQLACVALAWPLLAGLRTLRPQVYARGVVPLTSIALIGVGLWACCERLA